MAQKKLKLSDLKVQSFVTSLNDEQMNHLKGGYTVQGRRFSYRVRWTAVDTRSDMVSDATVNPATAG